MLLFTISPVTSQARAFVKFGNDKRMELGGWVHGGATFNPSQANGYNGPVVFADQANRFQLNQFYLFLQRPVISETNKWDFGGRFDFLFGTERCHKFSLKRNISRDPNHFFLKARRCSHQKLAHQRPG